MITVRPGSHAYRLLQLLIITGEFPYRALGILGSVKSLLDIVYKMQTVQHIKLKSEDTILKTRLFQMSGKGDSRTIRLNKHALKVLNDIHPDARDCYLASFPDNRFTGQRFNIWRNHRVAESVAMCMMAGIETAPYLLPDLQNETNLHVIPEIPCFYLARNFKSIMEMELNKTTFTRVNGLVFYPGGSYAVYNTRDAAMKWSGGGEMKAQLHITDIVRRNAGLKDGVSSALLFGKDAAVALQTVEESDRSRKQDARFDKVYTSIHYIPMTQTGIDLLKILIVPDWREKIISSLFPPEMRPNGYGSMEYDAYWEERIIFSFLDSDIARLIRFNKGLKFEKQKTTEEQQSNEQEQFEVVCYPWQQKFVKEFLCLKVKYTIVEMPEILEALGIISPEGGDDEYEG